MNNQVFEIVQAMSGQGNCITIPGPYLDFFAGDRQQHLLAAILNQLVFWSGKSTLENGWFYKEHAALAKEIRAKDGDVVRKAMFKITEQYLAGVIEEELRQVSGTPKKHYRVDQEALIAKIFPQGGNSNKPLKDMDSAQEPNGNGSRAESKQVIENNGNGSQAECIRPKSRMETAQEPNPGNGSQAESYLYTDLKNRSLHTDHKNHAGEIHPVDNFAEKHPEAVIFNAEKSLWGSAEDLEFSEWFYARVVELHERAAEFDGMISRPREPNWTVWANEIRLLREDQGCNHEHMRILVERIQNSWWCEKVKTAMALREKWPELAVKLCPANLTTGSNLGFSGKVQADIPKGFRG
ncbi:TPA: hypothetical protein ND549_005612 [Klebsiella michiganensis]|nr:hypothetical protein [Klebsiella michiganensis]HCD7244751.1 hypothetical protein [Klebsiella michiganensis]HCD7474233.1 hypothetical protein [Klebsiella michiganensis]HCD7480091.1 hypothetical protein [Klebsiella michiganensis]HCD7606665.1 hypothetical protein [Klebsiella michiganensis]